MAPLVSETDAEPARRGDQRAVGLQATGLAGDLVESHVGRFAVSPNDIAVGLALDYQIDLNRTGFPGGRFV